MTAVRAVVALKAPCAVALRAGEIRLWCACGRSARQPFCDGSHPLDGPGPVVYQAARDGEVLFCGCKRSKRGALCDASHKALWVAGP